MKCSQCHSDDAHQLLGDDVSCVNCGATGPVERGSEQAPDNPPAEDEPAAEPVVAVETEA